MHKCLDFRVLLEFYEEASGTKGRQRRLDFRVLLEFYEEASGSKGGQRRLDFRMLLEFYEEALGNKGEAKKGGDYGKRKKKRVARRPAPPTATRDPSGFTAREAS